MSNSLWTIGLGTLAISAVSGTFTGVSSIIKNKPNAGLLTGAAFVNSGSTAFIFFSCREYLVSPFLVHLCPGEQYARRRQGLGIDPLHTDEVPSVSQAVSWADLRWNKLLDSSLSGMLTGGVLRGIRTGPSAIIPGSLVVGAAATALQYGFNELSILRLRYVSSLQHNTPSNEIHDSRGIRNARNEVSEPAFRSLMKLFGVVPISDEEYLSKLKHSREVYLKRIAELEKQIEEERTLKESQK